MAAGPFSAPFSASGAMRLLDHCSKLDRIIDVDATTTTARQRLERELGGELARTLIRALIAGPRRRLAWL